MWIKRRTHVRFALDLSRIKPIITVAFIVLTKGVIKTRVTDLQLKRLQAFQENLHPTCGTFDIVQRHPCPGSVAAQAIIVTPLYGDGKRRSVTIAVTGAMRFTPDQENTRATP